MAKVSIDMHVDTEGKYLVSQRTLQKVMSGCRATLKALGPLAETISVIRVTFDNNKHRGQLGAPGPYFMVYYRDPLGKEGSLGCGYSSGAFSSPRPSGQEITEKLMEYLPRLIREHLQRSLPEMAEAQKRIEGLIA